MQQTYSLEAARAQAAAPERREAQLPHLLGQLRVSIALTILLPAFLLIWLLVRPASDDVVVAVDDVVGFAGPLLSALLVLGRVWSVVGRPRLRRTAARALSVTDWSSLLFGLAILCYAVGQMVWSYNEIVGREPLPFPSWADALFLSAYPLAILAVALLPCGMHSLIHRVQTMLDGVLVTLAIAAMIWYFVLGPILPFGLGSTLAKSIGIAYPLAGMTLAVSVILMLLRIERRDLRAIVGLIAFGLVVTVVTNVVLEYRMIHGTYRTGQLLDVGWVLGYMTVGLGAHALCLLARHDRSAASPSTEARRDWIGAIPYLLMVPVGAVAFVSLSHPWPDFSDLGFRACVMLLLIVVVLRQVLTLRENRQLQANTIAYAKRLQQANRRLETLATTDPLTELPNHRSLVTVIDRETERARRFERSCALLFIDLDHFKALNDSYGHEAGDTVLVEFARIARAALRGIDTVGRWGGEEFVIVLPEIDGPGARAIAEQVREAIGRHTFPVGGGARVTCSIGLAVFPNDANSWDRLISLADEAMYAAKRLGRDQTRGVRDRTSAGWLSDRSPDHARRSRDRAAMIGAMEALVALAEARDPVIGQRSRRVAELSELVARAAGLREAEAAMVGIAGRLRDIADTDAGLSNVAHAQIGAEIVSHVPTLRAVAPLIRAHHERWDGQGSPDGLAGQRIPLGARILAVVDAFVALTSDGLDRPALSWAEGIAEVRCGAGTRFDPRIVAALEQVEPDSLFPGLVLDGSHLGR